MKKIEHGCKYGQPFAHTMSRLVLEHVLGMREPALCQATPEHGLRDSMGQVAQGSCTDKAAVSRGVQVYRGKLCYPTCPHRQRTEPVPLYC